MRSGSFLTPCSPREPASPLQRWLPLFFLSSLLASAAHPQQFSDFTTPLPLKDGDTLVLGIVGAWQHWDTDHYLVRRVHNHLRALALPNVHIETVENHRLELAKELIDKAFPNGHHRIVIYGHSLGGSATVALARYLQKKNIPVLLTVQIDSVGFRDGKIPNNVEQAANLYQRDFGPIRGQSKIKPQDKSKTEILGNWRYHYPVTRIVPALGAPLYHNLLNIPHHKMEYDPEVWLKVETLILSRLTH
jgi:pimeloyl-ACP methyl ester carboxylesterase